MRIEISVQVTDEDAIASGWRHPEELAQVVHRELASKLRSLFDSESAAHDLAVRVTEVGREATWSYAEEIRRANQ